MSEAIQTSNFVLSISTITSFTLYIVLGIYAIFTAILYYHWKNFSSDIKVTSFTLITYFAITIPLLIIMVILSFII